MISQILRFSLKRRWLVVLFAVGAMALGAASLLQLPIDAGPDIIKQASASEHDCTRTFTG